MKILDTSQFILERIQLQPITNAELDKVKQSFDDTVLPLRQGDVVHVTYNDRYYIVLTDKDLIHKFDLTIVSQDFENGALMSYSGNHRSVHRMKLMDYHGGLDFVSRIFSCSDHEFDIIDVWRPVVQTKIDYNTLVEDNLKAEIKTNKYKKIYTRK